MKITLALLSALGKGGYAKGDATSTGFLALPRAAADAAEQEVVSYPITFRNVAGEILGENEKNYLSVEQTLSEYDYHFGLWGERYVGEGNLLPRDQSLGELLDDGLLTVTDNTDSLEIIVTPITFEDALEERDPFSAWSKLATLTEEDPGNETIRRLEGSADVFPKYTEVQAGVVLRFVRVGVSEGSAFRFLGIEVPSHTSEISLEIIEFTPKKREEARKRDMLAAGNLHFSLKLDGVRETRNGGNPELSLKVDPAIWHSEILKLYNADFQRGFSDPVSYCLKNALKTERAMNAQNYYDIKSWDAEVAQVWTKLGKLTEAKKPNLRGGLDGQYIFGPYHDPKMNFYERAVRADEEYAEAWKLLCREEYILNGRFYSPFISTRDRLRQCYKTILRLDPNDDYTRSLLKHDLMMTHLHGEREKDYVPLEWDDIEFLEQLNPDRVSRVDSVDSVTLREG